MTTSPESIKTRVACLAGAFLVLIVVHLAIARPWFVNWGATAAEQSLGLPGDEIVGNERDSETRAITIQAPAAAVWPWLAQLGQDRGGFYSYEILEDLAGCQMNNLNRLDPTLQQWRMGDKLWMSPPHRLGGAGHAPLVAQVVGSALAFSTKRFGTAADAPPDGSWSFVIQPIDPQSSRFIVRGRATASPGLGSTLFTRLVFDPAHFVMERKMMIEIKARAEGISGSWTADTLHVLLWTITFGIFIAAAVLVIRGSRWRVRLLAFLGAGLLFQVLTFVQPPLIVGGTLVATLILGVWGLRGLAKPFLRVNRQARRPAISI